MVCVNVTGDVCLNVVMCGVCVNVTGVNVVVCGVCESGGVWCV